MNNGDTFSVFYEVQTDTCPEMDRGVVGDALELPSPQAGSPCIPLLEVYAALEFSLSEATDVDSSSEGPLCLRALRDIYNATEVVEMQYSSICMFALEEPTSYEVTAKEKCWRFVMQEEMKSIHDNATWELANLPADRKPIGLKWVFKVKKDNKGNILKHKARLVAKGYAQHQGVDFEEVFAPMARLETVRLLIAIAAHSSGKSSYGCQIGVSQWGTRRGSLCALAPIYVKEGSEHMVLRLKKALYGLRQAPQAWNFKLDQSLVSLGFERSHVEHAVYKRAQGDTFLLVGVYVDDLIITRSNINDITEFKRQMKKMFNMRDLGLLCYYLGIEVKQIEGTITLCQAGYATKILALSRMAGCNPCQTPMENRLKLSKKSYSSPVNETEYRSIIGSLRYLVNTRPDIAYSVGIVSRYMEAPTTEHMVAVNHILRYVSGTIGYGCSYERCNDLEPKLVGFGDSDLAGNIDDRKSTIGIAFFSWSRFDNVGVTEAENCSSFFL